MSRNLLFGNIYGNPWRSAGTIYDRGAVLVQPNYANPPEIAQINTIFRPTGIVCAPPPAVPQTSQAATQSSGSASSPAASSSDGTATAPTSAAASSTTATTRSWATRARAPFANPTIPRYSLMGLGQNTCPDLSRMSCLKMFSPCSTTSSVGTQVPPAVSLPTDSGSPTTSGNPPAGSSSVATTPSEIPFAPATAVKPTQTAPEYSQMRSSFSLFSPGRMLREQGLAITSSLQKIPPPPLTVTQQYAALTPAQKAAALTQWRVQNSAYGATPKWAPIQPLWPA